MYSHKHIVYVVSYVVQRNHDICFLIKLDIKWSASMGYLIELLVNYFVMWIFSLLQL